MLTDKHKKNISKAMRLRAKKGLLFSKQHRKKLSEAQKGKLMSLETKNKISKTLKGRKLSLKQKKKLSNIMMGDNNPHWKGGKKESSKKIKLKCKKGGLYYERRLHHNRCRQKLKKNIKGSHTLIQWQELKEKYNHMCLCCKKHEPEITLTEDHIVPLIKGGSDYIENIQPLCRSCNSKKHTNTKSFIKNN